MKKILLAATAISACALAGPTAAQYQSGYQAPGYQTNANAHGTISFDSRISQLEARLEAGTRSGAIDRREATRLRAELVQLRRQSTQYGRGRASQQQQAALQQRLMNVRQQIRTADRGSYDRYERQDVWADYDRGDRFGYQNSNAASEVAFGARITQLRTRLDAGVRGGTIDRRQAVSLRQQIDQLSRLERPHSRSRTPRQQAELQQGIMTVRQQLRTADRGSYDRYEQRADWVYYDNLDGRGGPYEPVQACEPRTGIGGLIGSLFGVGDDCAGLRVGQRVGNDLYGVPTQHRNQYRDSGTVYYRSDGRQIYQIDARTHTVVRIHPM